MCCYTFTFRCSDLLFFQLFSAILLLHLHFHLCYHRCHLRHHPKNHFSSQPPSDCQAMPYPHHPTLNFSDCLNSRYRRLMSKTSLPFASAPFRLRGKQSTPATTSQDYLFIITTPQVYLFIRNKAVDSLNFAGSIPVFCWSRFILGWKLSLSIAGLFHPACSLPSTWLVCSLPSTWLVSAD